MTKKNTPKEKEKNKPELKMAERDLGIVVYRWVTIL